MLSWRVGAPPFFLLHSIPSCECTTVFYWWAPRLLLALAIVNCAAMNIGVHRSFWIGISVFLGYKPHSGITGSKGSSIFWGNLILFPTVAAPVCIPTNSALGFPFLHNLTSTCFVDLLMVAILTGVRQYPIVVFICMSLMISDADHPFICLWALCMSSLEKCLFGCFAHFLPGLSSWCWFIYVPYIFWRSNTCPMFHWQICFPIWLVPFSFCWCFH